MNTPSEEFQDKYCENCGNLIELEEFVRNPETSYCKHCRLTLFDGPDLYDAPCNWWEE